MDSGFILRLKIGLKPQPSKILVDSCLDIKIFSITKKIAIHEQIRNPKMNQQGMLEFETKVENGNKTSRVQPELHMGWCPKNDKRFGDYVPKKGDFFREILFPDTTGIHIAQNRYIDMTFTLNKLIPGSQEDGMLNTFFHFHFVFLYS